MSPNTPRWLPAAALAPVCGAMLLMSCTATRLYPARTPPVHLSAPGGVQLRPAPSDTNPQSATVLCTVFDVEGTMRPMPGDTLLLSNVQILKPIPRTEPCPRLSTVMVIASENPGLHAKVNRLNHTRRTAIVLPSVFLVALALLPWFL